MDEGAHFENIRQNSRQKLKMVRMEGLEPPRLSAPEPKSGVSTNSTTSAKKQHYKLKKSKED